MLERLVAAVQPAVVPSLRRFLIVFLSIMTRHPQPAALVKSVCVGGIKLQRPRCREPTFDSTRVYPIRISELGEMFRVGYPYPSLKVRRGDWGGGEARKDWNAAIVRCESLLRISPARVSLECCSHGR